MNDGISPITVPGEVEDDEPIDVVPPGVAVPPPVEPDDPFDVVPVPPPAPGA